MHPELERLLNQLAGEHPTWRIDGEAARRSFDVHMQILQNSIIGDGTRFDAGESALLARQLLYIKSQEVQKYLANTQARSFVPVSNEVDPAAETFSCQIWTQMGMAKIVANYGEDFPRTDVYTEEVSWPVKSLGNSYGYSIMDLRRSSRVGGTPLSARRANAARTAHEILVDKIAALGNTTYGLGGFAKGANVPIATGGSTTGFTGSWVTNAVSNPSLVLADLRWLEQQVYVQSKGVHRPDTMLFSSADWTTLTTHAFSGYDPRNILKVFLDSATYIKNVDQWHYLDLADAQNDGPRGCVYNRNSQYLTLEIPQEFEQFAIQQKGLEFEVPCHSRIGGVVWWYPLSGLFFDNQHT
jgi:hypothetical protein